MEHRADNARVERELTARGGELRRLARGLLFDPSLAEDVIQEAWLGALEEPRRWRDAIGPRLAGAVRNLARNTERVEMRRRRREQRAARPDAQPAAEDHAARIEVAQALLGAVGELAEPYRRAIVMRYLEDRPPREIARAEGVPVDTVRTWLQRGLVQLRRRLDADHEGRRDAFLSALLPLAGAPLPVGLPLPTDAGGGTGSAATAGPPAAGPSIGALTAMSTKSKIVAVVAVALMGALGMRVASTVWPTDGDATSDAAVVAQPQAVVEAAESQSTPAQTAAAEDLTARRPVDTADAAPAGRTLSAAVLRGHYEPFPGVAVRARAYEAGATDGEPLAEARLVSDAHGAVTWSLPDLAPTVTVVLDAAPEGCIADRATARLVVGQRAPDLALTLYPLDLEIHGRIVGSDGQPIAAASVGRWSERGLVRTDAEGHYVLPGSSFYTSPTVYAHADGWAEGFVRVQPVGRGVVQAETLVLEPELRVRGTVRDPDGRPVEGALVQSSVLEGLETATDAEGRFDLRSLRVPSDHAWVYVDAPGFVYHGERFAAAPGDELDLDVTLSRGSPVTVQVARQSGDPAEGIHLFVGYEPDAWPQLDGWTDAAGAHTFAAIGAGEQKLWIVAPGSMTRFLPFEVPAGGESVELQVQIEPGRVLSGRVVDTDGEPVAGAMIGVRLGSVLWEEYICDGARTDNDGRFRFDQLPPEDVQLFCRRRGYARLEETVAAGTEEVNIELTPSGGLAGLVVDGHTGAPVDAFRVRFVAPVLAEGEERLWGYAATWSGDGHPFVGTGGHWTTGETVLSPEKIIGIEITAEGYAPTIEPHAVVRPEPDGEPLVFQLWAGGEIRGSVFDEVSSAPIEGARVRAVPAHAQHVTFDPDERDDVFELRTDATGRFAFAGLAGGSWRLFVDHPDRAPVVDGPFELAIDGGRVQRDIALIAGGVLAGRVETAAGEPIADALVRLYSREVEGPRRSEEARTDPDGRFVVRGLRPGLYQVSHALESERHTVYAVNRMVPIETGEAAEVLLRSSGSATVFGTVTGQDEVPDGLPVSLYPRDPDPSDPTDHTERMRGALIVDGRFQIDHVQPGRYVASVSDWLGNGERLAGEAQLEVAENGTADVRIELVRYKQ